MVGDSRPDITPLVTKVTHERGGSMFNSSQKHLRRTGTALALVASLWAAHAAVATAQDRQYSFNIPAENAAQALIDFSRQVGIQILFPYDTAAAHQAPAISGQFTAKEVLDRLLDGTGLEVAERTSTVITLRTVSASAGKSGVAADDPATQVIVTGTHIRGANPTSPVHVVSRVDIEQSGYAEIGDVVRSLPENFNGGQNPGVTYAGGGVANQNITNASTINLRGLGTDATLTLVNGHRLPADGTFQGSDISAIPLSAVQRIDVVPDGASALYGADAVAGVVNVVLRRNFTGNEVDATVGAASEGGGAERRVGALTGLATSGGYVMANFEYSQQDPITASERSYLSNMVAANTLLREDERHSLFVSAGQDVTTFARLSFDALVADRTSQSVTQLTATSLQSHGTQYTPSYDVDIAADFDLPSNWHARVTGDTAGNHTAYWTRYPSNGTSSHTIYKNYLSYIEATADGTVVHLPTGDLKAALGAGFRDERFQQGFSGSGYLNRSRSVNYAYGEVDAPLVEASASRTGLHELQLNASVRSEDYSDLGKSTTPKIGLRYVPFSDLTLRATWGKSFKVPSLLQMYGLEYGILYNASTLGGSSGGTALLTGGGNPDLKPEKATSLTWGADYSPSVRKTLVLSANVFFIDYRDRVVQPVTNSATALSNAQYAPFVELSPSAARQTAVLAQMAQFYNLSSGAYDPSKVYAIVYDQYENATAQKERGVDLSARDSYDLPAGSLDVSVNATWLRLQQQTITTQPESVLSGLTYYAPKFRGRAGIAWLNRGWTVSGFANFISAELDPGVTPAAPVGSWTTVDSTIAYKFANSGVTLSGVKVSLSASNLFDRAPPRLTSPASYLPHFDSTNASIVGRFVRLTVAKAW